MSGIFGSIPFTAPAVLTHRLQQDTVVIGARSASVGIVFGLLAQLAGQYTRGRPAPLLTAAVFAVSTAVIFRRESNVAQAALTQRVVDALNDDEEFEPYMIEDLKSQPRLWQNLCSKLKAEDFMKDLEDIWELACHHHKSLDVISPFFFFLTTAIYEGDSALQYRALLKAFTSGSRKLLDGLRTKGLYIEDFLTTDCFPDGQEMTSDLLQSLCLQPIKSYHSDGGSATLINFILEMDYLSEKVYSALDLILAHYNPGSESIIVKTLFLRALEENRTNVISSLITVRMHQLTDLTTAEVYVSWRKHSSDTVAESLKSRWDVKHPECAAAHKSADEYFYKEGPSEAFLRSMNTATFNAVCARVKPEERTAEELLRFWTFMCRLDESFILRDPHFRGLVNLVFSKSYIHLLFMEAVKACRPGIVGYILDNKKIDAFGAESSQRTEWWVAIRDAKTLAHFHRSRVGIPEDVLPQILKSDVPYKDGFTKYDHVKGVLSGNRGAINLEKALDLCKNDKPLTKLIQSFIRAGKFIDMDPLPDSFIDDTDALTFEAIRARSAYPSNVDHRLMELWELSCKFDDLSLIHEHNLHTKLITKSKENNVPMMIDAVGKHRCPNIIKDILTNRFKLFEKGLQGRFDVLIRMYKSPDLLDIVIKENDLLRNRESLPVLRALLEAGVEGVEEAIEKYQKHSSAADSVKIMREHLAAK